MVGLVFFNKNIIIETRIVKSINEKSSLWCPSRPTWPSQSVQVEQDRFSWPNCSHRKTGVCLRRPAGRRWIRRDSTTIWPTFCLPPSLNRNYRNSRCPFSRSTSASCRSRAPPGTVRFVRSFSPDLHLDSPASPLSIWSPTLSAAAAAVVEVVEINLRTCRGFWELG